MKRLFSAALLLILDIAVAFGAVYLAKFFQRLLPEVSLPDELLWVKAGVYTAVTVLCFYFQDLYDWKYWKKTSELISSILLGEGLTLIVLAVLYYILPVIGLERDVLLMAIAMTLVLVFVFREGYLTLRFTQYTGLRVVIFGDGENAKFLYREIRSGGYPVIFEGYVGRSNWDLPLRCLGEASDLTGMVRKMEPDLLVVAPDGWRGTLPIEDLLRVKFTLCDVIDGPTFYEQVTGRILVEEIRFYLQHRVGMDGKDFKVIKFRSMRQDAEKDGPRWASENDPRITRVGRIIRNLRIDELPQFINVIKNDMSFVGPRPERRYFVDQLEKAIPFYALRLHAKPGITGWAQINYPYGDTVEDAKEKLKFELYYMKHRSLWLDLVIIFQTLKVAVKGRGSQ